MAFPPISSGNALTSVPRRANALVPADPRHHLPAAPQQAASRAVASSIAPQSTGLPVASANLPVGNNLAAADLAILTLPAAANSSAYLRAAGLGMHAAKPGTLLNIVI